MNINVEITTDMKRRVALIAKRTGLSEAQIVADALEHGHSLDWQERFADKIANGLAAADRGAFASEEDIERVRSKHRAA